MKKYFSIILLVLVSHSAFAATDCIKEICRYVRAGASGNGTDWNNAYGTLPDRLIRGATYFISAGSYSGYTFNEPVSGTTPITILKATVNDHGTSVGWNDTYGTGQAVFNTMIDFTTSYWIFDGQTGGGAENNWINNFGFKVISTHDAYAVIRIAYTGIANDITIRHVDMQGKGSVGNQGGSYGNDGLAIYGASNITLSYYWMHGIGRCPFFISPQNVIFEHGWVQSYFGSSSVHSEVASIWGFDGRVGDTTFRYNLFTDIQSTGGLMWDNSSNPTSHMYVYGNVFYKPPGASWGKANGVIGGWTTTASSFNNVSVINNTFINVDQQSLSTFPQVYSGNVAYNNLFYNSQSPNFSLYETHDFNYFINSGDRHSETNGISVVNNSNPFVNIDGLDFRLKSATEAGFKLNSPYNTDPLGLIRGSDSNFDRGAFEFKSGQVITPPSTSQLAAPKNLRIVF